MKYDMQSIALCAISTNIYGYDMEKATHVALRTVREMMEVLKSEVSLHFVQKTYFRFAKNVP